MARRADRGTTKGRAVRVADLLPVAMKSLGLASARVGRDVLAAFERASDPAWRGKAVPERLVAGVLVVGVSSSSLREELVQFHRDRLLRVLRTALPNVPLADLRFVASSPGGASGTSSKAGSGVPERS